MQPFPHICTHCQSFIQSAVLPLSMDKIKKAITQMKSDSTSGKDGILAEVYNAAGNLCCIALQWWFLPNKQEFLRKIWQFIPCLHLFFFSFFFLQISSDIPIPFLKPRSVHHGSVSWDDCGSLPSQVESQLISLVDSNTIQGQHSQPTLTLLGQGCMHV